MCNPYTTQAPVSAMKGKCQVTGETGEITRQMANEMGKGHSFEKTWL